MPIYTFNLRDGGARARDAAGVNLPDREQAFLYANDVAHELMKGREPETRFWRLDVYENKTERIFEIPFASVDNTLDHLAPELRATMEVIYERERLLREVIHEARVTVRESQALVARSRGKPHLATDLGEKIIRDDECPGDG